jgi:hypothetical protein
VIQPDLFAGVYAPPRLAPPRPATPDRGCRAEYVQFEVGVWAMCVFALIPKNGFGHLEFPHYWGGPQDLPHWTWRVDRHGRQVPDGTFIFTSRTEAEQVVGEAFPGVTDLYRHMAWISIPSDDHRRQPTLR